ncbi:hypothetical protein BTN50_0740 [Candidatus Enterovibrio altilux]|uniref:Uncharacterized protein n=1 Tax=Candidatus Enterovibrio altilux TaxID=1927128 RepID=A0A291B8B9_9GAMM|nr:hypothetical protein BTN50_0740 [Candidatus Enterovibrio luxaltus]
MITTEFSASNVTDCEALPNLLKQTTAKSMKYQPMVLTIPDNITKPFVLNEQFHSFHQEKEQLFKNEAIQVI